MWAREAKDEQGERPGILESHPRTEGYEQIAERATELSDTRPVYVADREADISAGACHGISGRLVAPGKA